jgi:hypothetical protein
MKSKNMQSKKIIEIINAGYFKDFLDLKENNLLLQDELKETYPQITNRLNDTSLSERISEYIFAYDRQNFLDLEQYKKAEKTILEGLSSLEKFTNYIPLDNEKESPLGFLLIELFPTFLVLRTYEVRSFSYSLKQGRWGISLKETNEQLLHFNTLDLVYKRGKFYKDVRLGFRGFGATGTKQTIFHGLSLFYMVEDFEREKHMDLPTTITYGDLLRAQRDGLSKKDIIGKHLKNAKKLENIVNVNKFSLTESYTLIKAATEFDERTFVNFVKWFREKGRYISPSASTPHSFKYYRTFFICIFILDSIREYENSLKEQEIIERTGLYSIARDYVRMCRGRRRKLNINFTSKRKLEEKHDRLYVSIRNKEYRDEKANVPFEIHEDFKPLVKAIKKRDNPFKYLSRPISLIMEGDKMHHCVGSYIYFVHSGKCVIASVELDNVHYTLEIKAIVKDNEIAGYHLAQMQSAYNGGIKKKEHEEFVITFLNNIKLPK